MILADFLGEAGEQPVYYFAYGMLTDPEIMQGLELIGVAKLPNFRYEMLEYANVVPDSGHAVYGCLWQVDRRVIARLDQIEGYPSLYDRKTVPAYVNGEKYVAELYTMTPATREQLAGTMPRQSYVNKIVRGYRHAGVPLEQMKSALKLAYQQHTEQPVDEARMSPSAFAGAVEQGAEKGVLVGFEFEVLMPRQVIARTPEQQPELTPERIQELIGEYEIFQIQDPDEDLTPKMFDSLFTLKPGAAAIPNLKYRTATEAYAAVTSEIISNGKELFYRVPEDLRIHVMNHFKDREVRFPKTINGQLKFIRLFGNYLYSKNNRNKLEQIGIALINLGRVDWDDIFMAWFNMPVNRVEYRVAELFDFDPTQVYKSLKIEDFEDEYDDDYDYYDDEREYDYKGAARVLGPAVKQAFGRNVKVFNSYHQDTKNLTDWYIEPDGSLEPNKVNDGAAEIVSPPLPANEAMSALKNFYAMARQLSLYTNESTGLHINVSIPQNIDVLKLAVFLGDQYVLQQFGRQDSGYAVSAEKSIANKIRDAYRVRPEKKLDLEKLQKIAKDATGFHTASISNSGKYISFRHAGGDYLADYATIANTVGRFIRAMLIAADPTAYAQEYKTKLAKLTAPQSSSVNNDLAMQIRQHGITALTISLWIKGRTTSTNAIKYLLADSSIYAQQYVVHSTQANSESAKQTITNTMRNETRKTESQRAPVTKFVTAVIAPINANIMIKMQQLREQGVAAITDNGDRLLGYAVIQKINLPPTDPASKNMIKSLFGGQGTLDMGKPIPFPKEPGKK